jgi:hypothetical protein
MVMKRLHPLCESSPDMAEKEWAVFFESVKEVGVLEEVRTHQGLVVDGKHRAKAAHILGFQLKEREVVLPPGMIIEQWMMHVESRKDIPDGVKAIRAAEFSIAISKALEAIRESKDAKRSSLNLDSTKRDSQKEAADVFNLSRATVAHGRKVVNAAVPALREMVEKGEVSVSAAAEVATMHPERQEAIVADGPEAVKKSAAGSRKAKAAKPKAKEEKKPEPERSEFASPIDKMAAQARSVSALDGLGVIEKAHSKEEFIAAIVAKAAEHGLVVMPKDQPNPQSFHLADPLASVSVILDGTDEQTQHDIRDYVCSKVQGPLHDDVEVGTLAGLSDRPIDVVRLVYQQAAETEKAAIVKLVRGLERTEKAVRDAANPQAKKQFVPPTVNEVRAYCEAEDKNVDPEHFHAYYAANGWKQKNGRPIQDWKAAIVTWVKNNDRFGRSSAPFTPPSIEEARAYFSERSLDGDAAHFHAHYAANGWKQGSGQPIQNWKAAAVTWSKSQLKFASEKDKKSAEQDEEGVRMRAQTEAFLRKVREHVG